MQNGYQKGVSMDETKVEAVNDEFNVIEENEELLEVQENSSLSAILDMEKEMEGLSDDEKEDMVDEFISNNPDVFAEFQKALLSGGPQTPKVSKSKYTKHQPTRNEIKAKRKKEKANKRKGRK